MKTNRLNWVKNASIIIVAVGGIIGIVGGWWSLCDKYKNREPRLSLFVPYNWSGIDTGAQKRYCFLFIRISNSSSKSAYLYLETMSVYLKIDDKWYCTLRRDEEVKETDFPESLKKRFGLEKANYLNRFEDNVITYDKPLCGYITVEHRNDSIFERKIQEVKIKVYDCHGKLYTLKTDLEEQLKKDPYRKYQGSLSN